MSWSKEVWEKSLKIYDGILSEPFIKELASGALPEDKFARYIAQDEVYIGNYGRQMYELADLMQDPSEREMFRAFADSGIESEKLMHQLLIDRFGIQTDVVASEVTRKYNAHTQKAISGGIREVGLAAMLPCMWIYNRVGLHILGMAKLEGNPYREWIEEYGNEEFTAGVSAVLDMIDAWAEKADARTREAMTEAYLEAALFEYAFWDYGYRGEEGDYSYTEKLDGWI